MNKKNKRQVFRVRRDGPRPPVGPFDSYGEAMAFARNNVRVPDGKEAESFLDDRIEAEWVKIFTAEQADTYAPRKRRKIVTGIFSPMFGSLAAA